jgi:hypothetical protein
MLRLTRRELVLMGVTALVTAAGMYAAWQVDRAGLALRLSHAEAHARIAENQLGQSPRPLNRP